MLSKSVLEWPAKTARAAAQPEEANAEPPSLRTEQGGDPMDAQAAIPNDSATFEGLWRSRIAKP